MVSVSFFLPKSDGTGSFFRTWRVSLLVTSVPVIWSYGSLYTAWPKLNFNTLVSSRLRKPVEFIGMDFTVPPTYSTVSDAQRTAGGSIANAMVEIRNWRMDI